MTMLEELYIGAYLLTSALLKLTWVVIKFLPAAIVIIVLMSIESLADALFKALGM